MPISQIERGFSLAVFDEQRQNGMKQNSVKIHRATTGVCYHVTLNKVLRLATCEHGGFYLTENYSKLVHHE